MTDAVDAAFWHVLLAKYSARITLPNAERVYSGVEGREFVAARLDLRE